MRGRCYSCVRRSLCQGGTSPHRHSRLCLPAKEFLGAEQQRDSLTHSPGCHWGKKRDGPGLTADHRKVHEADQPILACVKPCPIRKCNVPAAVSLDPGSDWMAVEVAWGRLPCGCSVCPVTTRGSGPMEQPATERATQWWTGKPGVTQLLNPNVGIPCNFPKVALWVGKVAGVTAPKGVLGWLD